MTNKNRSIYTFSATRSTITQSAWAGALVFYVLLVFFKGYLYGNSDHIDLLSYVQYLMDQRLYPSDFFVQQIAQHFPNERSFLAMLLASTGRHLAWVCFLAHAFFGVLLIVGLFRLAQRYIAEKALVWLALFLLLFPLSFFTLGGNDLIYNLFVNSNPAKACGAWALLFFLQKRYRNYTILAILSTFFHPMVGLQVFVLTVMAYAINAFKNGVPWQKSMLLGMLVYACTAGLFIVSIFYNYQSQPISGALLTEIIGFRLPHHFIPSRFGLLNYLLLVPLFIAGMLYFFRRDKLVFYLFLSSLVPAVAYIIGVESLHWSVLFTTQWFKTTIWIKAFSVFALVAMLGKYVPRILLQWYKKGSVPVAIIGALCLIVLMLRYPEGLVGKRVYHFPFSKYALTDEMDIMQQIRQKLPNDVLFVQPGSISTLKFFGARSSYVDVKAVVHQQQGFKEWYRRVQQVYGLNASNRDHSKMLFYQADDQFYACTTEHFSALKKEGVTHILTLQTHDLDFPIIFKNNTYIVYQIQ
jgi:hypothetical protein